MHVLMMEVFVCCGQQLRVYRWRYFNAIIDVDGLFFIVSIQSRRRTGLADRSTTPSPVAPKVNHLYGVNAWKSWVQQRSKEQTQSEPHFSFLSQRAFSSSGSLTTHKYYGLVHPVDLKEDILECNSVELSFALTRFIREVRRPNGEAYSPDSIFYLCLGIQQVPTRVASLIYTQNPWLDSCPTVWCLFGQYLFLQGRIENIFTDPLYNQFTVEITKMLRIWRPKLLPSGMNLTGITSFHSRIHPTMLMLHSCFLQLSVCL